MCYSFEPVKIHFHFMEKSLCSSKKKNMSWLWKNKDVYSDDKFIFARTITVLLLNTLKLFIHIH